MYGSLNYGSVYLWWQGAQTWWCRRCVCQKKAPPQHHWWPVFWSCSCWTQSISGPCRCGWGPGKLSQTWTENIIKRKGETMNHKSRDLKKKNLMWMKMRAEGRKNGGTVWRTWTGRKMESKIKEKVKSEVKVRDRRDGAMNRERCGDRETHSWNWKLG